VGGDSQGIHLPALARLGFRGGLGGRLGCGPPLGLRPRGGRGAATSLDPIGTVGIDRCVRLRGLDSINREHEVMLDAWRRAWSEHVRLPPLNFTTSLH
jgi:hypothetical protein